MHEGWPRGDTGRRRRPPPGRAASGGAARPHLGLQPPGRGTVRACGSGHLSEGLRDGRLNELTRHAGWAQLPTGRVSASTLTVSAPHTPFRARGRAQAEGVTGDVPVAAATPGGHVAAPATAPGLGTERTEPASLGLPLREAGIHLPRALGAISSSVKWGPQPLPLPGTPWVAAWVGAWVALSLIPARPPEAPSSPRGRSQTRSLCSPRGNLKPLAAASSFTRSWDSGAPGGSVDKASHPLWVHAGPPRGPPRAVLLEADSLKTQDLLSMEPEFFLSVLSIKPFLGPNGVLQSPCNFKGGICILWADPSGRG